MLSFGPVRYKEVERLHDECVELHEKYKDDDDLAPQKREQVGEKIEAALSLLETINRWPDDARYHPHLVKANLLTMRAWSRAHLFENDFASVKYALADLRMSIQMLAPYGVNETLFLAIFGFADLLKRYHKDIGPSARQEAIEACSTGCKAAYYIGDQLNYSLCIARLGEWLLIFDGVGDDAEIQQGTELLMEAITIFKELRLPSNVFMAVNTLVHTHYKVTSIHTDEGLTEHINFMQGAIEQLQEAECSRAEIALLKSNLGAIFSEERFNTSRASKLQALELLNEAQRDLSVDVTPGIWEQNTSALARMFLDVYDDLKYQDLEDKKTKGMLEELKLALPEWLKTAYTLALEQSDASLALSIIRCMSRFDDLLGTAASADYTSRLALSAEEFKASGVDIGGWIDTQIWLGGDLIDKKNDPEGAAQVYLSTLNTIHMEEWPEPYFDLCARLADIYVLQDKRAEAHKYFQKTITSFRYLKDDGGDEHSLHQIQTHDRFIVAAALSLTEHGELVGGVAFLEELLSGSISSAAEAFRLFEASGEPEGWIRDYSSSRRWQASVLNQNLDNVAHNPVSVTEFSTRYSRLKGQYPTLLHTYYLQNLDKLIKQVDRWLLVPIFSRRETKLLLIPPMTGLSECRSIVLPDLFSELAGLTLRQSIVFSWDEESSENDVLGVFSDVADGLTRLIGRWLAQARGDVNASKSKSITVVSYGPLAALSLAMVQNPRSGEMLIDEMDVSYVPNLFVMTTLEHRLKNSQIPKSLGFLRQTATDLTFLELEKMLMLSAAESGRNIDVEIAPFTRSEAIRVFRNSSYWHMATHGSFNWGDVESSHLELDEGKLYLKELSSLAPEKNLRLVVLSACQSGVPDFFSKDCTPRSYLSEFFKAGAIGAIGTLWPVNDISSALLIGRFYKHHFEDDFNPAVSLRLAQLWLRDSSWESLVSFMEERLMRKAYARQIFVAATSSLRITYAQQPGFKPFESPFHWAAFILMGQ